MTQEKQLKSDCCKALLKKYRNFRTGKLEYACSECGNPCSIYSGEPKENFLQVGRMIECGACHPEKFEDCKVLEKKYKGIKCNCVCHSPNPSPEE